MATGAKGSHSKASEEGLTKCCTKTPENKLNHIQQEKGKVCRASIGSLAGMPRSKGAEVVKDVFGMPDWAQHWKATFSQEECHILGQEGRRIGQSNSLRGGELVGMSYCSTSRVKKPKHPEWEGSRIQQLRARRCCGLTHKESEKRSLNAAGRGNELRATRQ